MTELLVAGHVATLNQTSPCTQTCCFGFNVTLHSCVQVAYAHLDEEMSSWFRVTPKVFHNLKILLLVGISEYILSINA